MEVRDDFIETLEKCYQVTEEDCKNNAIIRFIQEVFRLFAPLM